MGADHNSYSIVVPTVGRPSLGALLDSLGAGTGPRPDRIVVVDDRRHPAGPLDIAWAMPESEGGSGRPAVRILHTGGGRGPAAARNLGWRATASPWVAFLDDDVLVAPTWSQSLVRDIDGLPGEVAATQGRIRVPQPADRRPTDWERNVAGLERARWATADMAYRRDVLVEVGGFDERFPRAFREDADLAVRVQSAGWLIVRGARTVTHPVRPAGPTVSLRLQAGNADDVLMRALHGPGWRLRAGAGPGRTGRHVATSAALVTAAAALVTGRRRAGTAAAVAWAAQTAGFAWTRIEPGPRNPREVATMAVTSALIPAAATAYSGYGWARLTAHLRRGRPGRPRQSEPAIPFPTVGARMRYGPVPRSLPADPYWEPKAVLFDRDGTLIYDRHYLKEPGGVSLMPGARAALIQARRAGLATGVVTNQSGVARGLMTEADVDSVNRRIEELLGPFDCWSICIHGPVDGCACRKPAPGLVQRAASALGVDPGECVVIGDIGADVEAAGAAGARSILVPTRRTQAGEIRAAHQVAPDLGTAVLLALGGRC